MKRIVCLLLILCLICTAVVAVWIHVKRNDYEIPKMYFEGDISNMNDKKDIRSISVKYEDGERSFESFATLKVQGTSSLAYDKKNFTIKYFEDVEHTMPLKVDVGWGAQNEYCLKANWIDKTHARNVVTAKLVAEVQRKYHVLDNAPANGAVDGFPIEVYANGEFHGIYTFNIPKTAWQFAMDESNPHHLVVCGEEWDEHVFFFFENTEWGSWSVEVGEETNETLEKLNTLIRFVSTSTDQDFKDNFEKYIDLDAALNYYILTDFGYLRDNGGKNMLLATYDGIKWYPSLYDLDTSWGADWKGTSLYEYSDFIPSFSKNNFFKRLEENYSAELSTRYFELRKSILTQSHVMKMFEKFEALIPAETFQREKDKWGDSIPGYDISQIEEFLNERIPVLDQKYTELKKK